MRKNLLFVCISLLILQNINYSVAYGEEFKKLIVLDSQLVHEIESILLKESEVNNQFILFIRVGKNDSVGELRIGAISRSLAGIFLADIHDKPVGCFYHQSTLVMVYGENDSTLFRRTTDIILPDIIVGEMESKSDTSDIPPPPVIIEPVVWIFEYASGDLKLKTTGRFTLVY